MATYNTPGVYIQDVKSGSQSLTQASSTIGALLGVTRSGVVGEAQLVSSFTEFIQTFANGLETPFLNTSYLPYAVHGFFNNGGQQLYVTRVASSTAVKAKKISASGVTIQAISEGTWGNDLSIKVAKSTDYSETDKIYDVTVSLGSSDSATVSEVTIDTIASSVLANSKVAKWIDTFSIDSSYTAVVEETIELAGGVDGVSDLTDTDYINALESLDVLDDVTFVGVPGQTSTTMQEALKSYCDNHGLFPFLEMPIGSTVKATKEYRKSISATGGCLVYPWGNMNDPLTSTLKTVSSVGHVMGVYSRTIEERGVHKAPAGLDAVVRGFVSMERQLTDSDIAVLNPVGVVCITSKPNAGIVIWGARGLNSDSTMRYVSDVLLNYNIKRTLKTGTQFAVFEPNDETLWSRVNATCGSFLEALRLQGALKGTKDEAYYITVDSTNNTDDTINEGFLNIEIGYSPVKPAEFVVIKLAHSMESQ